MARFFQPIKEGTLFALLGANGAGKSTTIKIILGLIQKDSGEIIINEGKTIGYSPETPYFPPFMNEREVLKYYGELQGIKKNKLDDECKKISFTGWT